MTLKATIQTKLVRLPGVERGEDFPLPEGTNTLPQALRLRGSEEHPDVFDLADRISLHTVEDSPQHAGRRYAALERTLAAEYEGITRVEGDDEPQEAETSEADEEGESSNRSGGDA